MNGIPEAVNLTAIQEKLAESGRLPEVEKKVRAALIAQSCLSDIRQALECVAAIKRLRGGDHPTLGNDDLDTAEMALLSTAVSLYARATSTQAQRRPGAKRERGPSQIADAMPAELLEDHLLLLDIRSQAIAHVYFDENLGGAKWHVAALLAIRCEDHWMPAGMSRRLIFDAPTFGRLDRVLPAANDILKRRVTAKIDEVAQALNKNDSPELQELFKGNMLDSAEFFGSEDIARRILTNNEPGASGVYSMSTT